LLLQKVRFPSEIVPPQKLRTLGIAAEWAHARAAALRWMGGTQAKRLLGPSRKEYRLVNRWVFS
jgi:hypothetical protein